MFSKLFFQFKKQGFSKLLFTHNLPFTHTENMWWVTWSQLPLLSSSCSCSKPPSTFSFLIANLNTVAVSPHFLIHQDPLCSPPAIICFLLLSSLQSSFSKCTSSWPATSASLGILTEVQFIEPHVWGWTIQSEYERALQVILTHVKVWEPPIHEDC